MDFIDTRSDCSAADALSQWKKSNESQTSSALRDVADSLRDPAAMPAVAARLAARGWPLPRIAFLHGDICRRELDIELEGVFGA
ncbi:hypothetical protein [Silanimonas lenta]|uniref:hypothetical protein n=1 Tax=Silanimonas lenta TaxID=265429 RepID=UPI002FE271B8